MSVVPVLFCMFLSLVPSDRHICVVWTHHAVARGYRSAEFIERQPGCRFLFGANKLQYSIFPPHLLFIVCIDRDCKMFYIAEALD